MDEFVSVLLKTQGVWAALFVFLLLYTIRRNDRLDELQSEREREYQKLLLELKNLILKEFKPDEKKKIKENKGK